MKKQHSPETLQGRLRAARQASGLTQQEVADRIGVKRPTYGNWEVGFNKPSIEQLAKAAEVLKVSPSQLSFGKNAGRAVVSDDDAFEQAMRSIRASSWTPTEAAVLKALIDVQVIA